MLKLRLLVLVLLCMVPWPLAGHVLVSEPERLRNDNHFTKGGFAERQTGECGPSELDPSGFFCPFRLEDDWSFDNPLDIIGQTRVPQPGLPGAPGFDIACTPTSGVAAPSPECPLPPAFPGGPERLGLCVPLGAPGGPAAGTCDLSAGAPRPNAGIAMSSALVGRDDVDVAAYDYEPRFGEVTMIGIAQTPACRENIDFFPTVAWAGPLELTDARSGELLFQALDEVEDLPEEVGAGLPDGYGIRVTPPAPRYVPRRGSPRPGYYTGFAQSAWLYNLGTQIEPCVEDAEACIADPGSTHFDHNDVFFLAAEAPLRLYALWWAERGTGRRKVRDAAMVIGTTDRFTPGDFAALEFQNKAAGSGRDVHGRCRDPRPTGRVDITVEEAPAGEPGGGPPF